MKKIKSKPMNPHELGILMEIGAKVTNNIINEMKIKFPKMKIGEPYNGELKKYFSEYINHFMIEDYNFAKKQWKGKDLEDSKKELLLEATYIECFLNWLQLEKGVRIKVMSVKSAGVEK